MQLFIASAIGGLGDAATFIALILVGIAVLIITGFLVFSWRTCSLVAARIACVFIVAVGVLFIRPWFFWFRHPQVIQAMPRITL